jgi:hypothetical protein
MVRLPAAPVRLLAPGMEALGLVSGIRGRVRVTVVKLSTSTHFLVTPLG